MITVARTIPGNCSYGIVSWFAIVSILSNYIAGIIGVVIRHLFGQASVSPREVPEQFREDDRLRWTGILIGGFLVVGSPCLDFVLPILFFLGIGSFFFFSLGGGAIAAFVPGAMPGQAVYPDC